MEAENLSALRRDAPGLPEWDDFATSNNGHFMQSSAWGRFKSETGWDTNYFTVRKNGEIAGGALLLSKKIPLLNKKVFYLPRGPIAKNDDAEVYRQLFARIFPFIKRNRGIFLRVDPYVQESEKWDALLESTGFKKLQNKWSSWNCPRYVLWLDLKMGEDALFKALNGKIRTKIRLPHKKGVTFREGGFQDLGRFCTLMAETAEQKRLNVRECDYYKSLYETFFQMGMVQIFCAEVDGLTIASAVSVVYGKNAWLLYAASSREFSHLRASIALQWEMIRWAVGKECTRYDFRGTAADDPPSASDPGYGVYKFKSGFNPDYIRMCGYYDYVVSSLHYELFRYCENNLFPLLPSVLQYMPKPLRKVLD